MAAPCRQFATRGWTRPMTDTISNYDMQIGSGIAAFEAKHFARASGLLSPLAEAGDPQAQYRMAIMAQNGLGMHENHGMAFRFMKAAAEAGMDIAQHGLGFMFLEGECTEQDPVQAAHWFRLAAEQGLVGSQTTLAMLYEEGRGVEKDPEEARKWYRRAGFDEV
jgi:TPR repeat protein